MASSNVFDTISGLPLHPLVVHAAVVLVPLGAIGLIACILVPVLRRRYAWLALALFLIGAVSVLVSKESGEQLAGHIGEPVDHAEWADRLTTSAAATSLVAIAWYLLHHLSTRTYEARSGAAASRAAATTPAPAASSLSTRIIDAGTALLCLVTLGLVVATGHSGATATWQDQAKTWNQPTPTTSATTPAASTGTTGAAAAAGTFTMAQVKTHNTTTSCYVAISSAVYDLTTWIARHPGGSAPIKALCGTDGTAAFTAKHGDDGPTGKPQTALAAMKIGTLIP